MSSLTLFDNVAVKEHVAACMLQDRDALIAKRDALLRADYDAILAEKPLPKGFVTIIAYDKHGTPIHRREGSNIWTLAGREYLALLMSYATEGTGPDHAFRNDRIAYIGFGEGAFPAAYNIARLHTPLQFASGTFLTPFAVPPTFPLYPSRTVVRYEKVIGEDDITFEGNTGHEDEAFISEIGMFTDGPDYTVSGQPMWTPGYRETTWAAREKQRPLAYNSFDPIPKKNYSIYLMWEVRF